MLLFVVVCCYGNVVLVVVCCYGSCLRLRFAQHQAAPAMIRDHPLSVVILSLVSPPSLPLPPPSYSYPLVEEETMDGAPSIPGREEGVTPELITMPSRFETLQEKGYIDVWWLYDDGGRQST